MRIFIRTIMISLGGLALGTVFHELYHWLTMKPIQVCYTPNGNALAFVEGYGTSSEFWAYAITIITIVVAVGFGIYDLVKTEDL